MRNNGRLASVSPPAPLANERRRVDAFGTALAGISPNPLLNYRSAGLKQWIAPHDYPLALSSGALVPTHLEIDVAFDFYAEIGVATMWRTDNTDTLEAASRYSLSVKLRDLSEKRDITDGWTPLSHLFGSAEFPARYDAPIVMPAGTHLQLSVRNNEQFPLALFLHFVGQIKEQGTR